MADCAEALGYGSLCDLAAARADALAVPLQGSVRRRGAEDVVRRRHEQMPHERAARLGDVLRRVLVARLVLPWREAEVRAGVAGAARPPRRRADTGRVQAPERRTPLSPNRRAKTMIRVISLLH